MDGTGSSIEKLKRLYESDIIGIIVSDTHGHVTDANDAFLQMVGYSREEVESGTLRWDRLTPPECMPASARAMRQLAKDGIATPWEKEYIHKDGRRVPVVVGVALLDGSDTETICFVLDNSSRVRAKEELARLNEQLERRVEERTRSLMASEAVAARTAVALATSEQQLRHLAARAEKASEAERSRIAREVHDVLGQELTGLKMDVAWVSRRLAQSQAAEVVSARLQSMLGRIDSMIGTVRRIATELRPGALDDLGLPEAMEGHARDFSERSGIAVELEPFDRELDVEKTRATALFRIFQELLTNVARHARATRVRVALGVERGVIVLEMSDDGVGISEAHATSAASLGLLGIRERALAFGGTFDVAGVAGEGTRVEVRIPAVSAGR
jgi:PAS domain S-box-containing protein